MTLRSWLLNFVLVILILLTSSVSGKKNFEHVFLRNNQYNVGLQYRTLKFLNNLTDKSLGI